MALLEMVLFAALVSAVILSWLPRRPLRIWAFRCAVAGAIIAIIDVALGNLRWQIVPVCVLASLTLAVTYLRWRSNAPPARRSWRHTFIASISALSVLVLLTAALVPVLMFPSFQPPKPSGPHGVGIADLHLIDASRAETMTSDPDDRRELMVRVWYPARVPDDAVPEPFLREVEPLYSILSRGAPFLKPYMLGHLQRVRSHSYLDAPLADAQQRFPVLIFSHGNSLYAGQNGLLMEHLASHGYVVFAIDHPYQASAVRFPDGRVAKYREDWQGPLDAEQIGRQQRLFYQALRAPDYKEYLLLIDQLISTSGGANRGVQLWVDDTTFLLNELARGQVNGGRTIDRFIPRVDLDRVGVFGMSLGGAVAGQFCEQDARCKAGLNMDGLHYGAAGTSIHIQRPFMFIYADQRVDAHAAVPFRMNDFAYRRAGDLAYFMTIAGASHLNFSDFAVVSSYLRKAGVLGDIEPDTMRELLDDAVLAFFNRTLRGAREPALDGMLGQRAGVLEFGQRDGRAHSVE
ncbi:alpha/beta hydrolase family protein [Steroidobacter cummioxidans]|uniref:alpha/beta hydrolase family protein n=1 Tax=Steroidobacter cummioxidans TaxID=1803913 RepID=UPI000E31D9F1|nr:hypothetical protein [Steroidobacter cummioxidans]